MGNERFDRLRRQAQVQEQAAAAVQAAARAQPDPLLRAALVTEALAHQRRAEALFADLAQLGGI